VRFHGVTRSAITNNRLHSFYPGMVVLEDSSEVLVGSNHLLRDHEPWTPFFGVDNGLDDAYGLLRVDGRDNSVIGNHFSEVVDATHVRPAGSAPVIIRLVSGGGNFVSSNHAVGKDVRTTSGDGAFEAQVDALLATGSAAPLALTTVHVDSDSVGNTILDSGTQRQVLVDAAANAFRPTPTVTSSGTLNM
jgi:inulin fructotransferase (DFA-I-forming)